MIRDSVASHGGYPIWKLEAPYGKQKLPPDGLSIIMPTYNKRDSLKRAMTAIADQEPCGLPIEIIVIDDGSTDGTGELFDSPWSAVGIECPDWLKIRYFSTGIEEWTSPANSYNLGFNYAKYNYLVHSGADIIWYDPTMLVETMQACDVDRYLIYNYYVLNEPKPNLPTSQLLYFAERGNTTLYPWCVVTSREALKRVGFYEDNYKAGAGEDDAMIMKMATIGVKFCRVANQNVINQEHKKQYTRDAEWKANTQHNVRVGYTAAADLRRKISRGELEAFK